MAAVAVNDEPTDGERLGGGIEMRHYDKSYDAPRRTDGARRSEGRRRPCARPGGHARRGAVLRPMPGHRVLRVAHLESAREPRKRPRQTWREHKEGKKTWYEPRLAPPAARRVPRETAQKGRSKNTAGTESTFASRLHKSTIFTTPTTTAARAPSPAPAAAWAHSYPAPASPRPAPGFEHSPPR